MVVMLFHLASLLALPPGLYLVGALTLGGQQLRLAAPEETFAAIPALKVLMLPFGWGVRPSSLLVHAAWWAALTSTILALVGFATRLALLVVAVTASFLIAHFYSYHEMHHPEALLVMTLWLLALGPRTGLCLDELLQRVRAAGARGTFLREPPHADVAPHGLWSLRTVQWLFVLIYLSAGLSKVANGGLDWLNGYTLTYYFLQDGLLNDIPMALWLADKVALAQVLSAAALVFELTFVLAVLAPSTAWLYLGMGIGMHSAIYLTQRAPFFTFMAMYIVFLPQLREGLGALRLAWAGWLGGAAPSVAGERDRAPWAVLYDGLCPLCVRTMTILDYLDGRNRLRYVDFEADWEAAERAAPGLTRDRAQQMMHVVSPDGVVTFGFSGFRRLAGLLPLLWPWLPLLYLPGAGWGGDLVYGFVANRRSRAICRAETCSPTSRAATTAVGGRGLEESHVLRTSMEE